MKTSKKTLLINGPVGKRLVSLTIPMVFGILGIVIFNIVDTFYIGKIGPNELAAFTFTFPVVMAIASLAMGIGIGASAAVSRAIGEGDRSKAQRLTTDSLILALLLVIFFVIIGLFTIDPLFTLMGASSKTLPLIREYMSIWYPGVIFLVIPMVGNNAIRATGDTKTPGIIMLIAAMANFILDPLLIFGFWVIPGLGLAGAAIATVIARAITLCVALWVLHFRERLITMVIPSWSILLDSWKRILYIGLPTAGARIIVPLATGVIIRIISSYGHAVVAGFGVASRIEFFSLAVVMALSSVIGPFVGQNWGAGMMERVKLSIRLGDRFSMIWGFAIFLILSIIAKPLASLFSDNREVITACVTYLRIVPVSYGLMGVFTISTMTMNVLNRPLSAAAITIMQMIALYIPLAYAGSYLYGLTGVFCATALSYSISGVIAYLVLRRILR